MATLDHPQRRARAYGAVEVLKGIDLEVGDGEFVALVGPSGCGKSTLLAMIAGLETVTAGEIRIGGRLVNAVPPKDRDIAMVFQSYALYPTMTVRENITFGMESRRVPKPEQDAAVARVAALLQIEPLLRRKPGQLSGGQRQRVAMGRALVRDPTLFLFDEPLSNLDAKLRVEMRTEIKKLHHRIGKTTVYVTHDQVEAMTLASRIAVMHKGELQQFDEPAGDLQPPGQPVRRRLHGLAGDELHPRRDRRAATPAPPSPCRSATARPRSCRSTASDAADRRRAGRSSSASAPSTCSATTPATPAPPSPASPASTAPVEVVEPTGAETMVVLRFGEPRWSAASIPTARRSMGETDRARRRHGATPACSIPTPNA